MTDIPDEWVEKAAVALHQACIDRWAVTGRQGDAGMTKHGSEAHIGSARAVLEAVQPDVRGAVLDDVERRIRAQVKAAPVGSMEWRAHMADLAHIEQTRMEGEPDA